MMALMLIALVCTTLASAHRFDLTDLPARFEAIVQPIVEEQARKWNSSISVGVKIGTHPALSAVAGLNNHATGAVMTAENKIPMGSATKLWTAVLLLQAAQNGTLSLDTPCYQIVDKWLTRVNGTTLLELWNGDATINKVTTRQLLGMRAGLHDYDDNALKKFTLDPVTGKIDVTPLDFIHMVDKTFLWPPGTDGSYSSVSFILAGLVYAAATGAESWKDVNQYAVVPDAILEAVTDGVLFVRGGVCSDYPDVSHQYTTTEATEVSSSYWDEIIFKDLIETSCLNGWVCGNIAARPATLALLLHHVFSPSVPKSQRILNDDSLKQMEHFIPFTSGFAAGLPYGLGLMNSSLDPSFTGDMDAYVRVYGHAGQDYGSGAPLHYYNAKLDLSIVAAINSDEGTNCSSLAAAGGMNSAVSCAVYAAVLKTITNGTVSPMQCAPSTAAVVRRPELRARPRQGEERAPTVASSSALLSALEMMQSPLNRVREVLGTSVLATAVAPIRLCESDAQCVGASAGLTRGDCVAWMDLWLATNGSGWTKCASPGSWLDPCSCIGAVTCSASQITSLNLGSIGMTGGPLPQSVAHLAGLTKIDFSNNPGLAATEIPLLPFAAYTGGCDLSRNAFKCPLPAAAAVPCAVDINKDCVSAPISIACLESVYGFLGNPQYVAAYMKVEQDIGIVFNGPTVQNCIIPLEQRANHTCDAVVDWNAEPMKSDWAALVATAKAINPAAIQCKEAATLTVQIGPIPGVLNFPNGLLPSFPWLPVCTRADRLIFVSGQGRNNSASNTLHWTSLVTNECTLGVGEEVTVPPEHQQKTQQQRVSPPSGAAVAPQTAPRRGRTTSAAVVRQFLAEDGATHKNYYAEGSNPVPPLTEQCLANLVHLLQSPTFAAAYGTLNEHAQTACVLPVIEKCEVLSLPLTGVCDVIADWSSVAAEFAATNAAASAISPGATMCNFDAYIDDLNITAAQATKFGHFHFTIGRYEAFPIPAECTTTDRNRMAQWLSGTGSATNPGAVNVYYTWSDAACAVQM